MGNEPRATAGKRSTNTRRNNLHQHGRIRESTAKLSSKPTKRARKTGGINIKSIKLQYRFANDIRTPFGGVTTFIHFIVRFRLDKLF